MHPSNNRTGNNKTGRRRMPTNDPHDRITQEYAGLADTYDTRWSFYVDATARATVARLPLCDSDRLLDIGCGTGVLLRRLSAIHPAARLTGVDPVPEMLAIARRRLPSAVELQRGWAETLPFADRQFDVVVSCNMFHYIAEPDTALREIKRVLRPDGRLVITDWCGDYLMCRVLDAYQRLFGRAHGRVYRTRECAALVEQAGYATVDTERYKIDWRWGLMTARFTAVSD